MYVYLCITESSQAVGYEYNYGFVIISKVAYVICDDAFGRISLIYSFTYAWRDLFFFLIHKYDITNQVFIFFFNFK